MAKTTGKITGKKTTQAKAAPQKVAVKNAKVTKATKATKQVASTPAVQTTKIVKSAKTAKITKTVKSTKSTKGASKAVSKTTTQKGGNGAEQESAATRYYKMITIEQNAQGENMAACKGRYSGKKPRQASSKGCTKLFRAYNDKEEQYPESIIFGMHECTRSRKKKKKFFYIGTKEDLEAPQEVPIHQKGDDGKYLVDESGNKVPKLDPNTGEPLVIRYRTNSKVKKLFCPEKKDKMEVDGERKNVVRAYTAEEFGELENPPYTFAEYQDIYAKFVLLRNYDAPDDDEDENGEVVENNATKKATKSIKSTKAAKTSKATKATKSTKATKATKVVKSTKMTKTPKIASTPRSPKVASTPRSPKVASTPRAAAKAAKKTTSKKVETPIETPVETPVEAAPVVETPKTPIVSKNSNNLTVKKNTSNGKKTAGPKKAAPKKVGKKASVKKN